MLLKISAEEEEEEINIRKSQLEKVNKTKNQK